MQSIINRTPLGPAPWPHSKFRLTEEQLLLNGGRVQIDPKITVERFRIFCEFVEEHGGWNTTQAEKAGIADAGLINSSVYHHCNLLPKVYWRAGWGRGTPRRKGISEPDTPISPKLSRQLGKVVEFSGRLDVAEQAIQLLQEDMEIQICRVDDAHNRFNEEWYKKPTGPTKRPSRFERFRKELGRRLHILLKGGGA